MTEHVQQSNLSVPIAIVLAGGLIALALYFGSASTGTSDTNVPTTGAPIKKDVPKVTAADHIIGNPNAPIKIVEYTDLECPFCKQFHQTMKRVMDEYGASGKVAWVLRNFPLAQLHPNAPKLALAAECVAELGGNSVYWKFIDAVFVAAPINTFFDFTKLDSTAQSVGVNVTDFRACYDSERTKDKVEKDFNDAVASGAQGTPFNILVDKSGKNIEIAGAQPYEVVKATIEAAL